MTHFRMFVRAAPIGLLICTLVIASATGEELSPREIFIRSVDDVAPALRNATTTALSGAQSIVASSSDLLIAAAIPVGALATFFGYFMLGPVLFVTAFLIGGGACFVSVRAGMSNSEASAWLSVVAMLVGGGFSGFAACRMLAVGMFAVGACLGVATSAALKVVLWSRVFPASPHAGFIFGSAIMGTVFGVTALSLRKQMLILSTSYAGAFGMFFGIGHFAGHFPTLKQLDQVERGMFDPWALGYLAMTVLFGTGGMFLQLHMTRDKVMPSQAPYSRRRGLRRVRQASVSSDWTADGDEEWERELLAAESRIEREPPLSRPRHHLELDESLHQTLHQIDGVDRTLADIEAPALGRTQSQKKPADKELSPTTTWLGPLWDAKGPKPTVESDEQSVSPETEDIVMSFGENDRMEVLEQNRSVQDVQMDSPEHSALGRNSIPKACQD